MKTNILTVKNIKSILFVLILCFFLINIYFVKIKTQTIEESLNNNGISIAPSKIQKNLLPGSSSQIEFSIINNENYSVEIGINIKSFRLQNNNQSVFFERFPNKDVLEFIKNFKNKLYLETKERVFYNLNLQIPSNSIPSGYSFALIFETKGNVINDSLESLTAIKQSIGVPIILNISSVKGISYGDVILENKSVTYNAINNSIYYSIDIKNNSNQFITPVGNVNLETQNYVFGLYQKSKDFNTNLNVVSPFSSRNYQGELFLNQQTLGIYNFSFNILYGINNNVVKAESSVLIYPLVILIFAGILLTLVIVKKFRNAKNKDI